MKYCGILLKNKGASRCRRITFLSKWLHKKSLKFCFTKGYLWGRMFFRLLKRKKEMFLTEWFFVEPSMVLLWHRCEEPIEDPLFLRVYSYIGRPLDISLWKSLISQQQLCFEHRPRQIWFFLHSESESCNCFCWIPCLLSYGRAVSTRSKQVSLIVQLGPVSTAAALKHPPLPTSIGAV